MGAIIGIVVGFASVCLFILAIFIYRKYKNTSNSGSSGAESGVRMMSHSFIVDKKVWEAASLKHIEEEPMCSICLCSWNGLETACGHYYHIECITEWVKRKNECGLCRKTIKNQRHKIYCLKCNLNVREMDFKIVEEMYKSSRINSEAICNHCKKGGPINN